MDEREAKEELLDTVTVLRGVRVRLEAIQKALPVPVNQDAMFEDEEPYDVATAMAGAIEYGVAEYLDPFARALEGAANATRASLARDFRRNRRRYAGSGGQGGEPCRIA